MSNTIVSIPFHGREVTAVEVNGEHMIVLKPVIEQLGLDYSSQHRRLSSKSWACMVKTTMQLPGDTQSREVTAVTPRTLMMLLATIDENRVAEDVRPLLIAYQSEVADVIEAYFRDGAAVNPRADDLSKVEQIMRIMQAAKGLIDPGHLEAKARIVLARAIGERPEIPEQSRPLYAEDYLYAKGLDRETVKRVRSTFGRRVSAAYKAEHGEAANYAEAEVAGRVRRIKAYTEADRDIFDQVWSEHYADVFAPKLEVMP